MKKKLVVLLFMKKIPAVLLLITTILACHESLHTDEEMVESATRSDQFVYNRWDDRVENVPRYDGSDGGVISKQVAMEWLANLARQSASDISSEHYFHKDAVAGILKESGSTGLRLFYATTDTGERLITCAVNALGENLTLSNAVLVSATDPATQQAVVNIDKGRQWVRRYQTCVTASTIRSHYFGKQIVSEIISQPFCTGLKVQYATDDGGRRKLILSAVFSSAHANSRTNSANDGGIIGDFSFPCPSVCPPGGGGL